MFSFFKGNPGDNVSCGDKRVIFNASNLKILNFSLDWDWCFFFGLPGIKVGFCSRQEERRKKFFTKKNIYKKREKKWIYLEDVHWGTPGVELTRRQSGRWWALGRWGGGLSLKSIHVVIDIPSIWDTLTTDSYHRTVLGLQIR